MEENKNLDWSAEAQQKKGEFIKETVRLSAEHRATIFTGRGGDPTVFGTIEIRSGKSDSFFYDVLLEGDGLIIASKISRSCFPNESPRDYFIEKWINMFNEYHLVELFAYFFPGSSEEGIKFSFPIVLRV